MKMGTIPRQEEELVELLRGLVLSLERLSPAQPRPIHPVNAGEIALGWLGSSDDDLSLSLD